MAVVARPLAHQEVKVVDLNEPSGWVHISLRPSDTV